MLLRVLPDQKCQVDGVWFHSGQTFETKDASLYSGAAQDAGLPYPPNGDHTPVAAEALSEEAKAVTPEQAEKTEEILHHENQE